MPSNLISLRKDQLRYQISQAIEVGEKDQLSWLRSQWVHRYGIDTLQEAEKQEEVIKVVQDLPQVVESSEISIEKVEPIILDDFINKNQEEPDEIEEQPFTSWDLIPLNDNQPNQFSEEETKVLLDEETKKSSTDKKCIVLGLPPRPSINHFRRWLPSLDKELPKAS